MFALFKPKKSLSAETGRLYSATVMQARLPVFYRHFGVPDTVDGRFDMICLHAYLVIDRLQQEGPAGRNLAQALFDRIFMDMDLVLREMGVGDLGIPKHIKRMMKGFNGRAMSYRTAMRAGDSEALKDALQRNLFGGKVIADGTLELMVCYISDNARYLARQSFGNLEQGIIKFIEVEEPAYEERKKDREDPSGMVA